MHSDAAATCASSLDAGEMRQRYVNVRTFSQSLSEPLAAEDCVIQSMPDVSPTRWHLAHTSWFFETFVLARARPQYQPVHPAFEYLFNSYYNRVGQQFPRPKRGLLSRPTVDEILQYRREIDVRMDDFFEQATEQQNELLAVVELGIQHEQQHQELMLTDIKHVFSCNPLYPAYHQPERRAASPPNGSLKWVDNESGLTWFGHQGRGFGFDNEFPRHQAFVQSYQLASRLVNCGEYLEFIQDGGYQRSDIWLSLGWGQVESEGWQAPLYWICRDGKWWRFTLEGLREVDPCEPVSHVSYFEADAFARWRGARLPTELEWELAVRGKPVQGNFVEQGVLEPLPAEHESGPLQQMFGDLWEWTSSAYSPYPGYTPPQGALGEYNGKFMCNQYVLRGGSCTSSQSHIRPTYRNFFPPEARWQFTGIRLAR